VVSNRPIARTSSAGDEQAGLWGLPKRWASAEAPAPSADGLEARAGKPPAAGGLGTAMVSDAPAAAAAAEMPLVRSAGIELNTAPAAPGAAAPGEEKSVEMSHGAATAAPPATCFGGIATDLANTAAAGGLAALHAARSLIAETVLWS